MKQVNNSSAASGGFLSAQQGVCIVHDTGSQRTGNMQRMTDGNHNSEWILKRFTYKISNKDKQDDVEVWVSRKHNSSRVTVTVRATGILDLRAINLMHNIDQFAKHYKAARIIIDLGRTQRIQDSGLAMLLLLKKKLGHQIEKIKLINTGHLTDSSLAYLPAAFEIN